LISFVGFSQLFGCEDFSSSLFKVKVLIEQHLALVALKPTKAGYLWNLFFKATFNFVTRS
jgi:hypothetical protein